MSVRKSINRQAYLVNGVERQQSNGGGGGGVQAGHLAICI